MHDPVGRRAGPALVSVCSALEVDLSGQVASEQVAGRPITGVGGSADFFEGAHLSPGGVRIVALAAATPQGAAHPDSPAPGHPGAAAQRRRGDRTRRPPPEQEPQS